MMVFHGDFLGCRYLTISSAGGIVGLAVRRPVHDACAALPGRYVADCLYHPTAAPALRAPFVGVELRDVGP
eukprot:6236128-Prymnesium_polylepis.1